jgi:aryl-alcohol dehydrogenase-like predicted oxidoreductase
MDAVTLGRTGLKVSVAGLGSGGFSRLGQANGLHQQASVDVVRRAIDLGITYIDTAPSYGTEEIVGTALTGRRDDVVISTKAKPRAAAGLVGRAELRQSLERSLRHLRTDVVDVFHLHGVSLDDYDYCVSELVPELHAMRDDGLIRFLALSERFALDPAHEMLQRAAEDDWCDVLMVGFNVLNPSARHTVFPRACEHRIGIEVMFAVRHALANDDELRALVAGLVRDGFIAEDDLDPQNPLDFLVHGSGAESVVDAAYRFCRHEPGCHVVLTGTGNAEHLQQNVASINRGPLPDPDLARLRQLFGSVDHVTAGGRAPR